jgi:hypothetical protein
MGCDGVRRVVTPAAVLPELLSAVLPSFKGDQLRSMYAVAVSSRCWSYRRSVPLTIPIGERKMAHPFLLPDFVEYRPLPDGSVASQLQRPETVVGAAQGHHEGSNGSASTQGKSQARDKPVIYLRF